jgi:hypothetical protein
MEEHFYPEINDYLNYLDYFFINVSNSNFDLKGDFPYGNSIYLIMLEAQFEASIVKSIWDRILEESSLSAINSTLEEKNTTWYESLGEYGLWLYYTGDRAIQGKYFTDATFFPQITIKSEDNIEFDAAYVDDVNISENANRYLEFQEVQGKAIDVQVIANNNRESGFRITTPFSSSELYPVNNLITTDPLDSDQMVLVITNAKRNESLTTIDVALNGSIDLTTVYPFPNPVIMKDAEIVRFQNVPPEAELNIYNTSGKRVARVLNQGSSRIRSWSLINDDGEQVSGGIYVFLVQGDGLLKTGKFSVIR